MSKAPAFYLTRCAALDLRDIYERSRREWGDATANRYIADIYIALSKAAANPDAGLLRKHGAAPFLIVLAQQHLVVYDRIPQGIVVLTLMHQVRDIASLIADLSPSFLLEVEKLKAEMPSNTPRRAKKTG